MSFFHQEQSSPCNHWTLSSFKIPSTWSKKILVEYFKTHWSVSGDVDLTTREAIIQLHILVYNKFSSPNFVEMHLHAFQMALIKNNGPVYRSVMQVCLHITKHTWANFSTLPFNLCACCWKHVYFKEFYMEKQYYGFHQPV